MTTLSDRQRQLLFDYSLGLISERETEEVEALIESSEEAAELYQSFHNALAPLENVELEPCPDDLMERLFARLREAAESGSDRLEQLLAAEQSGRRPIRIPLWRNWSEVAVAAAAVVLFVGILFPAITQMRARYHQAQCAANLSNIYGGLRNYVSDHDGLLPAAAVMPGSPWWKVGYPGQENYSNTRQVWLLPRHGYVDPSRFLCTGRREGRALTFEGFSVREFSDFPSRAYIHYSVRIRCSTSNDRDLTQRRVLMADRNPLSERLPSDLAESPKLRLCDELMTSNSHNHGGQGQNVLLYDGSVEFARGRRVRIFDDDIYLIEDMCCGTEIHGDEVPTSEQDIFLVP